MTRRFADWRERLAAERDVAPARDVEPVAPAAMARQIPVLFRGGECLRFAGYRITLLRFQGGRWTCRVVAWPAAGALARARRARFLEATLCRLRELGALEEVP